jgi:hypothetical protein
MGAKQLKRLTRFQLVALGFREPWSFPSELSTRFHLAPGLAALAFVSASFVPEFQRV